MQDALVRGNHPAADVVLPPVTVHLAVDRRIRKSTGARQVDEDVEVFVKGLGHDGGSDNDDLTGGAHTGGGG